MYRLFLIIFGFVSFENASSYVLLEVTREKDNVSDVDTLIPNGDVEKNSGIISRKRLGDIRSEPTGEKNSLESIVLAIDTGVKQLMSGSHPDIVDTIADTLVNFAKNTADPEYRSRGQGYITPEIIHFKSDKPSLKFEINSQSMINVLRDVLQSKLVRRYMDKFSKEAAVVYRAIKQEINKQPSQSWFKYN